jgi:DNA-binding beta-propeller fold protein YncE
MRHIGCALILAALVSGCGGAAGHPRRLPARRGPVLTRPKPAATRAKPTTKRTPAPRPRPEALVTAESENRLLIVDLRTGKLLARTALPAAAQYVAAEPGLAVATSPRAGEVMLLGGDQRLRVQHVFGGFAAPDIVAIAPDGEYAYVADDTRGQLDVIRLSDDKVISSTFVGYAAHHFGFSPDERQLWIALGESARTIVILTPVITTRPPPSSPVIDPGHPRVVGRFHPGFPAHDLAFSPNGRQVWITSTSGPDVAVFRARDHHLLFRVPVGPPPQHVAFAGAYAYLTSGYASTITQVDAATGRILARTASPRGSFELDAADGYVAAASLFNGNLAIYTPNLKRLHVLKLAPATRDVEITER